ncbi:hypothetical protein VTG60DRAFT_3315 [Thermothelomyces hinnuleus]
MHPLKPISKRSEPCPQFHFQQLRSWRGVRSRQFRTLLRDCFPTTNLLFSFIFLLVIHQRATNSQATQARMFPTMLYSERTDLPRRGLTGLPVEILKEIVGYLTPASIGWGRDMAYWPSDFHRADDFLTKVQIGGRLTGLRDSYIRKEYLERIKNLLGLSLTCRYLSTVAREALYSRVRIDNWSSLVRLTESLLTQTDSMCMNAQYIERLELDMDLENAAAPWLNIPSYSRLDSSDSYPAPTPLGDEGIQRLFRSPIFSMPPSLKKLVAEYRRHGFREGDPSVTGAKTGPIVFFTLLCYLPRLRTLVLRYSEKNVLLDDDQSRLPHNPEVEQRYFYQTLFELLSEAVKVNLQAGVTPDTAPAGTWPCPALEHLEVYGHPFPWDTTRAVAFTPAWSFHTIAGLKTLRLFTLGNAVLRSKQDRDDVVEGPPECRIGFRREHMRACMETLNYLELHNTPFQLSTLCRALLGAKNLTSLRIHVDDAFPCYDPQEIPIEPNLNTILPLCAGTLENLELYLKYYPRYFPEITVFFFGLDRRLTCLGQLHRLRHLYVNLRILFGRPREITWGVLDPNERDAFIAAAGTIRLPQSLQKLVLAEEHEYPVGCKPEQKRAYSEQLMRLASVCAEGKDTRGWSVEEVVLVSAYKIDEFAANVIDKPAVEEAFLRVPGLRLKWGKSYMTPSSRRRTIF